jgi:hypothetical protein
MVWLKCGILYVGTRGYQSSQLCEEVGRLPDTLRTKWQRMIVLAQQNGLLQAGPAAWSGCFPKDSAECFAALLPVIEVVGISKRMAERLGFAPDELTRMYRGTTLEVCRIDCLDAAAVFRRSEDIRERKKYKRGHSVDKIWDDLFRGLVAHFSQIAVIDQYCIQRLANSDCALGASGVEQFLRRVDDCQSTVPGTVVQVISSLARGQSLPDVMTRLHEFSASLPNRRIASLELRLADDRDFKRLVHYRCVRFQSHHSLILDRGIDILEGHTVKCTHLYSFTLFDDTLRRDENEILAKSQRARVYERPTPTPMRPPAGARANLGPAVLPPRPGMPSSVTTR